MLTAFEKSRVEKGVRIAFTHRPIGNAAGGRLDLDHRLGPVEPARTGPDNVETDAPALRALRQRTGNRIGPHGNRCGILWHENPGRHGHSSPSTGIKYRARRRLCA